MARALPFDEFGTSPIHTRGVLNAMCALGVWLWFPLPFPAENSIISTLQNSGDLFKCEQREASQGSRRRQ
jgi:hypothetical protein